MRFKTQFRCDFIRQMYSLDQCFRKTNSGIHRRDEHSKYENILEKLQPGYVISVVRVCAPLLSPAPPQPKRVNKVKAESLSNSFSDSKSVTKHILSRGEGILRFNSTSGVHFALPHSKRKISSFLSLPTDDRLSRRYR